jgi:hypothetical protein
MRITRYYLIPALLFIFTALFAPARATAATCFCEVKADGNVVAKPSKGGFIQGVQAESCRNYCRGLWDSSAAQRLSWAKLAPNACGDVRLNMGAAIGTAVYQGVRAELIHGVNGNQLVTTCSCPTGQTTSNSFGGKKYCITSTGTTLPVPDQLLQGGYLIQGHMLYQVHGEQSCTTKCQ